MSGFIRGPLRWERAGPPDGPALAVIHPNPADGAYWLYQVAHFSSWCQTVAIDLPGYGRSPAADEGVGLDEIARACWTAVDEAVGTAPAVILGVSIGSTIAQFMAALAPDRSLAIVLTGGGYYPTRDFGLRIRQIEEHALSGRREHVLDLFGPSFRGTPLAAYFADLFVDHIPGTDPPTIARMYRELEKPVPEWLHSSIAAPTLIVTGSADAAHEGQFALQRRIAGSELRVLEGAGHFANLERPWEYDAYVIDFLRRHGLHRYAPDPRED
jgi:3-oxoadipate enol-lactonase/3-oxoadipate enol-lactonase/4-carboxymuconolactone decarboxylase